MNSQEIKLCRTCLGAVLPKNIPMGWGGPICMCGKPMARGGFIDNTSHIAVSQDGSTLLDILKELNKLNARIDKLIKELK